MVLQLLIPKVVLGNQVLLERQTVVTGEAALTDGVIIIQEVLELLFFVMLIVTRLRRLRLGAHTHKLADIIYTPLLFPGVLLSNGTLRTA